MDKIGIITFHRAINYGAMLQAVALQNYIQSLGYEAELIDYVDHLYDHYKISYKTGNQMKSIVKYLASGNIRRKNKRFHLFLQHNARMTERQYNSQNICSFPEEQYKCFFTGSDQVFNPKIVEFDDNYLLSFVKDKSKCNSYAASIGLTEMESEEADWLSENIRNFSTILIRENAGKKLLESIGIHNSVLTCDPTFLLSKDEWEKKEHQVNMPEKYILYYGFRKNDAMELSIEELQKKTKLPVYLIGDALRFKDNTKLQAKGVGPAEWLWLIHHAQYIVTNSFHGMVFSFIYEKQVWIADSDDGTFSRMEDFLGKMGCMDRIVTVHKQPNPMNEMDYNRIKKELGVYITSSQNILRSVLDS